MATAGPLWRKIRDDIVSAIESGRYVPGDKLPSVAELAEQYATSRPTVRRALDGLLETDVLTGRPGVGIFVTESEPDDL